MSLRLLISTAKVMARTFPRSIARAWKGSNTSLEAKMAAAAASREKAMRGERRESKGRGRERVSARPSERRRTHRRPGGG